jgi:hypothetical protein
MRASKEERVEWLNKALDTIKDKYGSTQIEVAEKIDYKPTYISQLKGGYQEVSKDFARKLIKTFRLETPDWLDSFKFMAVGEQPPTYSKAGFCYAEIVYKGDSYKHQLGTDVVINHTRTFESNEIESVYAVAKRDHITLGVELKSTSEIKRDYKVSKVTPEIAEIVKSDLLAILRKKFSLA